MKNLILILTLVWLIAGCKSTNGPGTAMKREKKHTVDSFTAVQNHDTLSKDYVVHYTTYTMGWADSIMMAYIAFSDNEIIRAGRKEHIAEQWLFDQTLKTDTAEYQVYQIGHDLADESSENQKFVTDQWVYLDTARQILYEYDVAEETLGKWWSNDNRKEFFYPVYELSPKTTALVIPFQEGYHTTYLDTIFNKLFPADSISYTEDMQFYKKNRVTKSWKYYDTSGSYYRLIKSEQLEKELRKHFKGEYYVYGTNGFAKVKVKAITFGLNECISSIVAFCFEKDSLKSIGHPVFCSDRLIDLTYAPDYKSIEKSINEYESQIPADYSDSIKTKILGNVSGFYFTYNDDFLWASKKNKSKCRFPSRGLRYVENREAVVGIEESGLDLFGTGCD